MAYNMGTLKRSRQLKYQRLTEQRDTFSAGDQRYLSGTTSILQKLGQIYLHHDRGELDGTWQWIKTAKLPERPRAVGMI